MQKIALTAAAAVTMLFLAAPSADAAKWCRDGASGTRCGYASQASCRRAGSGCYRATRQARYDSRAPAPRFGMPGQIEPNRPYWSSPYQCFVDDGGGRFHPCDQPSGGGYQ